MFPETGPCTGHPSLYELGLGRLWSCALPGRDPCTKGNHIRYFVSGPPNALIMDVQSVHANYCQGKPEGCRCKNLLGNVLDRYPTLRQLRGQLSAHPFMAGCRCYLGSAARRGFTAVSFNSPRPECTAVREFNVNNYQSNCKEFDDLNCNDMIGSIFRG